MAQNLAVNHLPLEALPAVQTWTANCKRDRKTVVTWHPQVCRLPLTMKNLMLNVSIVSFTAFHYPHQHTVDTPVCLPPRRRSQPSSFKSWHYTVCLRLTYLQKSLRGSRYYFLIKIVTKKPHWITVLYMKAYLKVNIGSEDMIWIPRGKLKCDPYIGFVFKLDYFPGLLWCKYVFWLSCKAKLIVMILLTWR